MRLRVGEVAAATQGRLVGPDVVVDGATTDSRTVSGGELFVPLVAERDGHDFVTAAVEAGASAYLTAEGARGGSAVEVEDTGAALLALGGLARARLPERVVGVTGSVGKTSTKDLLAAVFRRTWVTVASPRSFNNELGVPLTLLNAPEGCQAAVIEMGTRGPGEIARLCAVALPTVGVVTMVAAVHTETFGTIEEVARAKAELVAALPAEGTAVLNSADPRVRRMADASRATVLLFGEGGDVVAEAVVVDEGLRPSFRLRSPWGDEAVRLAVRGAHQVENALAAAAAALACGVPIGEVAAGLGDAALSPWRMQLDRTASGALVLNDAYNANPTSMAAALRSLAALPARRRVALLGTMAELGPSSAEQHRATADLARQLGIRVIAVDEPGYGVAVARPEAALDALGPLEEGDAVLVKGSRVAGLERLAERLTRR